MHSGKLEDADFKYNNSFTIHGPKYANKALLIPFFVVAVVVVVVVLFNFWYLDKLEGADFKYGNSFFEFQSKNTQKGNFYFCTKLCSLINLRVLISSMAKIFPTYSPKLHKLDIFGSRFENCLFCIKYFLMTYWKVLTSNVTTALQNSSLQITQRHFCLKFNAFFVFEWKFVLANLRVLVIVF